MKTRRSLLLDADRIGAAGLILPSFLRAGIPAGSGMPGRNS